MFKVSKGLSPTPINHQYRHVPISKFSVGGSYVSHTHKNTLYKKSFLYKPDIDWQWVPRNLKQVQLFKTFGKKVKKTNAQMLLYIY